MPQSPVVLPAAVAMRGERRGRQFRGDHRLGLRRCDLRSPPGQARWRVAMATTTSTPGPGPIRSMAGGNDTLVGGSGADVLTGGRAPIPHPMPAAPAAPPPACQSGGQFRAMRRRQLLGIENRPAAALTISYWVAMRATMCSDGGGGQRHARRRGHSADTLTGGAEPIPAMPQRRGRRGGQPASPGATPAMLRAMPIRGSRTCWAAPLTMR